MINCKKCRRAGEKLFLKGERCFSPKCAVVRKNYPPGQHGNKGQKRMTEYGLQLSYKQRIKNIYGVKEAQLKRYFNEVRNKKGNIGEMLMNKLEMRLDNVIFRSGLADSRTQARQMVSHGSIEVNNRKVSVASYEVKAHEEIKIKQSKQKNRLFEDKIKKLQKEKGGVDWVEFNSKEKTVKVLAMPTLDEVGEMGNIQMVIEYYSR